LSAPETGLPRRPMPLGIHHLALRVADCEASRAFYVDTLGLHEIRRSTRDDAVQSIWLGLGEDAILMLERRLRGAGPESGSGHVLALAVEDLPSWEERLAARGVPIEDRTAHTIYLRDPDGHRLGLTVFPRTT